MEYGMGYENLSGPIQLTECKPEADVAQLVEQPIRNRQVTSSSLVVGSNLTPS